MEKFCFITLLTIIFACSTDEPPVEEVPQKPTVAIDYAPKSIAIEPVQMIAWVDQLRVRALPAKGSRVIAELKESDTLFYQNARTVNEETVNLRDTTYREPWLKVKTKDGQEGWVFGGGVRMLK